MDENNVDGATQNTESTQTETGATSTETVDVAALQKELAETKQANSQLYERAKKAEGFVKVDNKWVKAPKPEEAVRTEAKLEATTGELNETQLFLLESKGITDDGDISLIQNVMKRSGLSLREALNDEYVQSKLASSKREREVKAAVPSSSRRAGQGNTDDVDYWLPKIKSGEKALGDISDFKLRVAVQHAREQEAGNDKVPPWHRK